MKRVIQGCPQGMIMIVDTDAIRTAGFLSPVNPMTRIWCLFEAWTTLSTGNPVSVAMGHFEGDLFVEEADLSLAQTLEKSIDVRNAEATCPEDITNILAEIGDSSSGAGDVNRCLIDAMWAAYTSRGVASLQLAIQGPGVLKEALREGGVDIEEKNPEGWNALHGAASSGYSHAVQVLLQCKANVDALNNKERTPAMLAAWRGHHDVVDLLSRAGADLTQKDAYGVDVKGFEKKWKAILMKMAQHRERYATGKPSHLPSGEGFTTVVGKGRRATAGLAAAGLARGGSGLSEPAKTQQRKGRQRGGKR